jgi:cellulose synthase/poly-beta-1,6-N-acetylglucosamine synthase-like glycosyltransferase
MPRKMLNPMQRNIAWVEEHAIWVFALVLLGVGLDHVLQWLKDCTRVSEHQRAPAYLTSSDEAPMISVLVPAWNEAGRLQACVDSILGLRYSNKEIILCAGGSDSTWEIASEYANARVVVLEQRPGEGKQVALRRCFERSSGEIIFLTDADCILEDECFEATLGPVIEGQEEVCTGSWRPADSQLRNPFVQFQWAHHFNRELALPAYVDSLDGRNAAIRRNALQRVGAFLTFAPTGTDFLLSTQLLRAGYRIRFVSRSRVCTWYPETVPAYWKQASRWFRNRLTLGFRYHQWSGVISHLRAGIAAIFMLVGPLIIWRSRLLQIVWLGAFARLGLAQLRMRCLVRSLEVNPIEHHCGFADLLSHMLIGWIALARGLIESLLPFRRWRW